VDSLFPDKTLLGLPYYSMAPTPTCVGELIDFRRNWLPLDRGFFWG
jgi:hypothetical protein